MNRIASVNTLNSNKSLWFDAKKFNIGIGDSVIVQTSRGLEYAVLDKNVFEVDDKILKKKVDNLMPVVRIASNYDKQKVTSLKTKSKDALLVFKECAKETNPDMIPLFVEYLFDEKKAVFYFEAKERQDFRELVKMLSSKLRIRIDMHQIGERERSTMLSGIGMCGQELCCARLGNCPKYVSIKMAKVQGMSLNPDNISGMCGKLLCCLNYEFDEYEKFTKRAPKLKANVKTPEGEASVIDVNMPKEYIEIKMKESEKRVKVPLEKIEINKRYAKENNIGEKQNIRPNYISKDSWEEITQEIADFSLESVYVDTKLSGNEKIYNGQVNILPGSRRKKEQVIDTTNKKNIKNKRRRKNISSTNNYYKNANQARVRRKSRKINSDIKKPGYKSSNLNK